MKGLIVRWLILTIAIIAASYLIRRDKGRRVFSAFFAAALLGILNAVLRPVLLILTLPVNILTLGLFTFVINALLLKMVSGVVPGFEVVGFWPAILGSLVISLVSWLLNALVGSTGRVEVHRPQEARRPLGMNSLTPAMGQYLEIKEQHKDAILLYQMGDFYEMFFEDAVTASRILDITLTSRNKNKGDSIPLCGVPCRAASPYIARLIDSGYKVAVCEQVEDPGSAKGVVKRAVVRIVTPGLVLDAENLPAKENNFLGALVRSDNLFGLAFMDISTGDFRVSKLPIGMPSSTKSFPSTSGN